jgi:hypothetical protein
MNRYIVAFISILAGIALTTPYAVLKLRDMPAPPPRHQNSPPREMTFQETVAILDICVLFYAVTYFTGRLIYAALGRKTDHKAVQDLSNWHMKLLHGLAGVFMVCSPFVVQPAVNRNVLALSLSIGIGLILFGSAVLGFLSWVKSESNQDNSIEY